MASDQDLVADRRVRKEALALYPARRIRANDVIGIFADVMVERGVPECIRSDNGPEMIAKYSETGQPEWARRPRISYREALGRMVTARALMAN